MCGDCPLKLLERLIDANNTLDAGKTSALMSDFAQKMDNVKDRAKDVEVRKTCHLVNKCNE